MSNIVKIEDVVYGIEQRFAQVLSDQSVSFQREAEFALQPDVFHFHAALEPSRANS